MTGILVISDLHLRESIRAGGELLEGDSKNAIDFLGQFAQLLKFKYVIIAGDIFHQTRVNDEELYLFKYLIKKFTDTGIQTEHILVIQGNHDRGTHAIPEMFGCTDINDRRTIIENFEIIGSKFESVDAYKEKLHSKEMNTLTADKEYKRILVLHAPCKPFSSFSLSTLEPSDFNKDDIVICGDTHVSSLYEKGPVILSPGCLSPGNKDELRRKNSTGVWYLSLDKDQYSFAPIEFPRRGCLDVSYMAPSEVHENVKNFLKDHWQDSLFPVIITTEDTPAFHSDKSYIEIRTPKGVEDNSIQEASTTQLSLFERVDGVVTDSVGSDDPHRDAITNFIRDLIITDNPEEVISRFIMEVEI